MCVGVGGVENKILCLNTLFLQIKKNGVCFIFFTTMSRKTCKKKLNKLVESIFIIFKLN
jgi:hypothetical protein